MSKSPLINALLATLYISIVASVMYYGPKLGPVEGPIAPVAFLSLFVLSAAVMGFLFLYQPTQFYFEGKKNESVQVFLKTVGVFACITILLLGILFFLTTL